MSRRKQNARVAPAAKIPGISDLESAESIKMATAEPDEHVCRDGVISDGSQGEPQASAEEAFRCEGCDAVIDAGDSVCSVANGGFLCKACAPTWGHVLEFPAPFGMTEAEAKHEVTAHLAAGGSLDDPFVGDIAMLAENIDQLADAIGEMVKTEALYPAYGHSPSMDALHSVADMTAALDGKYIQTQVVKIVDDPASGGTVHVFDRTYPLLAEPIKAAEYAAQAAMAATYHEDGPALQLLPTDDLARYVCGLKAAADFCRSGFEPGAPEETLSEQTLWNHLALGKFHDAGVNSFDDQPFALRLGWMTFAGVVFAHQLLTAEYAAKAPPPEPQPIHRVPIEDTTLEMVDGVMDRFDDKR